MSKLATCWKITRSDDEVFSFTDHDKDIIIDAVTYLAAVGYKPSAIEHNNNGSTQNMEVLGVIHFSGIDQGDLRNGLFDYARVDCFHADWETLNRTDNLASGWLGRVSIADGQFNAELRSMAHKLHNNIGDQYTPQCRANLGDSECGFSLVPVAFTVTTGNNNRIFTDTGLTQALDYFKNGFVTFTSGNNKIVINNITIISSNLSFDKNL